MWIVYGAWAWLIASSLVTLNTRGDVAAANHALPGLLFVLILHAGVWLYQKNKRPPTAKHRSPEPSAAAIDDSIYDQVASELSINQIHAGLMARAIAEADGDKDKTQAIYIKLRVAAIVAEREQAETKQKATQPKDDIKESFFNDTIKRGEQVETENLNSDKTEHKVQSKADLEKELQSRRFKAEMIANYQAEKNKNQAYEKKLNRALGVILFVMLFGATVYAFLNPAELANSNDQELSSTLQKELDQLAKAHPDFEQIAKDPAFHEWVKTQPVSVQRLYESTSAQDNIVLLNMYKRTRSN